MSVPVRDGRDRGGSRALWLTPVLGFALAVSIAGCFAESYGTPGMDIRNDTDTTIDVVYRRPIGGVQTDEEVMQIEPRRSVTVIGLHQTESRRCLRGTVIAMDGERIVATIDQPCEGIEWVVTDPASSAPG